MILILAWLYGILEYSFYDRLILISLPIDSLKYNDYRIWRSGHVNGLIVEGDHGGGVVWDDRNSRRRSSKWVAIGRIATLLDLDLSICIINDQLNTPRSDKLNDVPEKSQKAGQAKILPEHSKVHFVEVQLFAILLTFLLQEESEE